MVDYKLHYSNGFTYKPKYDEYPEEYWVSTLHFDQKCKITNYDPATSNGKKKGYITIDIGNNGTIIKNGEGDKLSENKEIADFSEKKFSIFHDIAALDDNGDRDKLTMEDIENLDESYKTSWGLKDLIVDLKKGVATLVWGVGDILRIDFETEEEKNTEKVSEGVNTTTNNEKVTSNTITTKTDKDSKISSLATSNINNLTDVVKNKYCTQNVSDLNLYKNIPSSFDNHIKKIAEKTGYSEDFIKYLISTEGFITTAKDIGDGCITVGFGHTNRANSNTNITKGQKITVTQAFEYLAQDIKDKENEARKHFDEFDILPTSLKEAIIDIAFNRGHKAMSSESVYRSLRANLKLGENNYPAAAVRTRQEFKTNGKFTAGLRRRNCYRFLLAIRDLSPDMQLAAMRRFENSGQYYTVTLTSLKNNGRHAEADSLKQDWEKIKKNAELNLTQ